MLGSIASVFGLKRVGAALIVTMLGFGSRFQYSAELILESLQEFAEKYPETAAFVQDYPDKKDTDFEIDLSNEVGMGNIPLFLQWDMRWGYRIYGTDCMGVTGCGPTCLSMVVCGLTDTAEWDPYSTALFAEEQGYYEWGVGTSWALMTEGAQKLGLTVSGGSISEDFILSNLSVSTPMIASMRPGDFTDGGHFIVLTGIDENGEITVNDPNSLANSLKSWPADRLVSQMKGLWVYQAG